MFSLKLDKMGSFYPLEVVSCYRDPQLQVGKKLKSITKLTALKVKSVIYFDSQLCVFCLYRVCCNQTLWRQVFLDVGLLQESGRLLLLLSLETQKLEPIMASYEASISDAGQTLK